METVRYGLAAAALAALGAALPASGAVITQTLNGDNTVNTWISNVNPTTKYNTGDTFYVYEDRVFSSTTYIARGLIRFDLPSLPSGATVTSATLSMNLYQYAAGGSQNVSVSVYQLLVPWVASETTWNKRNATTNWSSSGMNAGADRSADALDTLNTNSTLGFKTWNITSLYNQWLSGAADNDGLAILTESNPPNEVSLRFFSAMRNDANVPYLTVTYQVPEPSGALVFMGVGELLLRRRRR